MTEPVQQPAAENKDKTIGIISYMTLIGWVIAFVMYGDKKSKFGAFHLRQALGINCLMVAIWPVCFILMFVPVLGWIINLLLYIGVLVFWILGLIGAVNGEIKPVFIVGELSQKLFENVVKE